ncbi:hypothetical protein ACIQPT_07480, partial [Streptomyces sp. NPDC091289]|uniref:hypothetical protein n=1 Tax=Streptomyces sp. NPDC091289 TaxID=3365989 RepID=UPI0037F86206
AEIPGPLPARGVIHIEIPHTTHFTVVGNHLAQHPDLSCTAVGLAVRIQSLPQGTRVGIKALAAHCKEGEKRIAAALRELEDHGYLQRARDRRPNGKFITRTVFCNQPTALLLPHPAAPQQPTAPSEIPAPAPAQTLAPTPQTPAALLAPPPLPLPLPPTPPSVPLPPPLPLVPPPTAPKPPRKPLPQPSELTPELQHAATTFLSDLPRHTPQFTLSENDIHRLAPAVAAWLERATHPDTIRRTLTDDLPNPLNHPASLLKYRLTELLPPPPPGTHDLTALDTLTHRPRVTVTPFQTCDDCDRAFRSPTPGHCRDCRETRAHHEHRTDDMPTAA